MSNETSARALITCSVSNNRPDPSERILYVTVPTRNQVNLAVKDRLTETVPTLNPGIAGSSSRSFDRRSSSRSYTDVNSGFVRSKYVGAWRYGKTRV
jgi:hypothetical protein